MQDVLDHLMKGAGQLLHQMREQELVTGLTFELAHALFEGLGREGEIGSREGACWIRREVQSRKLTVGY